MIPSQQVYFLSGSVHPAEPVFCLLVERAVRPMSWTVRHLQIKWVKGSGKAGKRFMGGESFLGAGAGDGVEESWARADRRRGDLGEIGVLWGTENEGGRWRARTGLLAPKTGRVRRVATAPLSLDASAARKRDYGPHLSDRAATPLRPRRNSPSTTPRSDLRRGVLGGGGGGVLRPAFPWPVPSRNFPIMEVC